MCDEAAESEHFEVVLHDLALILGQIEQVMGRRYDKATRGTNWVA